MISIVRLMPRGARCVDSRCRHPRARAYQRHVVQIGLALLAIAALLGITIAAAVTLGLVRPVRRLLAGTAAVEVAR